MISYILLDRDRIGDVLPCLIPLIEKCTNGVTDSVIKDVIQGQYDVWVICQTQGGFSLPIGICLAVCEDQEYTIPYGASVRGTMDLIEFIGTVEAHVIRQGINTINLKCGRNGWKRLLKGHGYCVNKTINDHEYILQKRVITSG